MSCKGTLSLSVKTLSDYSMPWLKCVDHLVTWVTYGEIMWYCHRFLLVSCNIDAGFSDGQLGQIGLVIIRLLNE